MFSSNLGRIRIRIRIFFSAELAPDARKIKSDPHPGLYIFLFYSVIADILIHDFQYFHWFVKNWFIKYIFAELLYGIAKIQQNYNYD